MFEMHAKLTQTRRTRTAAEFRTARSAVMFSSDVSARGMDFPNVTHVISVGCPAQRDLYVHRVGRTARINRPGQSWLLVAPFERGEVRTRLGGIPLQEAPAALATAAVDMERGGNVAPEVRAVLEQTRAATNGLDGGITEPAYRSLLGKQRVVDAMNRLAVHGWGMEQPPALPPALVQKLGLRNCVGLNVQDRYADRQRAPPRGVAGRHGYGRFGREYGQGFQSRLPGDNSYGRRSSYGRTNRDG